MRLKHTVVFENIASDRPLKVYIATLSRNRLGIRVSGSVYRDYCGSLPDALRAYDAGNYKEGQRILNNWA